MLRVMIRCSGVRGCRRDRVWVVGSGVRVYPLWLGLG